MTTPNSPVRVPSPPPLIPQPPALAPQIVRKVGRDLAGMIYGTVICAVVGVAFYLIVQAVSSH